jgi:flagellar biogenesis protein FliO
MRLCIARAWTICMSCALAPSFLTAQQFTPPQSSGTRIPPRMAGMAVEPPLPLPAAAALQATPLASVLEPPPARGVNQATGNRAKPPVNFRLVSADEPVPVPTRERSLRLAPRGEPARASLSGGSAPRSVPTDNSPTTTLATVGGSLAAILGLFLIAVWYTRRFAPAGTNLLPKEAVELLGRAPLPGRQQMQLVRVGNKLLLVAFSPVGVETLTEITEPAEIEHLLTLCRRGQPGTSSALFREALAQLASEPAERGFVGPTRTTRGGGR